MMREQQETGQEKMKRSGMTKYEKVKLRIIVFVAVVLVTQAVVSVGSFLHFHATWNASFPEEHDNSCCTCQETGMFYGGVNIE